MSFEYLPTDTTPITHHSVAAWVGKDVYVDMGDSIHTGGEFVARLVASKGEKLIFHDGREQFSERMDAIVHIEPT